jgi:hypothetical protein
VTQLAAPAQLGTQLTTRIAGSAQSTEPAQVAEPAQFADFVRSTPLSELHGRLASERDRAVDAEELAAILEADGLSDEQARSRYGQDGLFALAEQLYAQGRGQRKPALWDERRSPFPWSLTLRGPLVLMPALSLLFTARLAHGMGEAGVSQAINLALALASAFGWGWSMALARLRFLDPLGVPGKLLRQAAVLGLPLGGLLGAVGGLLAHFDPADIQLCAAISGVFGLALGVAGALLSLERRRDTVLAFVPIAALALALSFLPIPVAYSAPVLLLGLTLVAAVPMGVLNRLVRRPGHLGERRLDRAALRLAVPQAMYGWSMAVFFGLLAIRLDIGAVALLPTVLSVGVLEAMIWHYQRYLQYQSRDSSSLQPTQSFWPLLAFSALYFALLCSLQLVVHGLGLGGAPLLLPLCAMAFLPSAWLANQNRLVAITWAWSMGAVVLGLPLLWPIAASPGGLSESALGQSALSQPALGLEFLTLLPIVLLLLCWRALHDLRSYR